MKKNYLIAILLWLSGFANAQSALKGLVVESESQKALIEARISCIELNKNVLTDEHGNYRMGLPKGSYTIQVNFIGYQPISRKVNIIDSLTTINFEMAKGVMEMNEVVITQSSSQNLLQSPSAIEVIKTSEMDRLGAPTIMDAITTLSGVDKITTGPYVARPVIRGLSGNRIVTVAGGVRLENQQWDDEHGLGISENGTEKVEIIKGPSALIYGPEALGGVIHFVDEQPAALGHTTGVINGTGFSNGAGFNGHAGIKGTNEKFFWTLDGTGKTYSDYYANNTRVANSRLGEFSVKGKIGVNRKWGTSALDLNYNQAFFGIVEPFEKGDSKEKEAFPREAEAPYHDVVYARATSASTFIVGKSKLKTTFGYQNDKRTEYEPKDSTDKVGFPFLSMNLGTATYDVKWENTPIGKLIPVIGVQGMFQKNTNSGEKRLIPDATTSDAGAYGVLKYQGANLLAEGGVRYDKRNISSTEFGIKDSANWLRPIDRSFDNLSTSFGLSYTIFRNFVFKGNVSQAFRAPNLAELTSNGFKPETQRYERGNSTFEKEHNTGIDGGLNIDTRLFTFKYDVFNNDISNYIYIGSTGNKVNGASEFAYKQADATLKGHELFLSIHPVQFNHIILESKYSMVKGKLKSGENLPLMPPQKFNNSLILMIGDVKKLKDAFVRFNVTTAEKQNIIGANEIETPGYTLFNVSLGTTVFYKKQPIEFVLAGNNIFNKVYVDHLSRLRQYNVANMGANFSLGIRVPFALK